MQRLPLSALRAFAAVYEAGGVRSAARALQVTHSSVSRHLHELEAWLGVALLEKRGARERLAFTPQGQALGEAALAGIEALTNAVDNVREVRRANSVVIATTASFAVRMGSGPWFDEKCEPLMDDELYPVATRRYWDSIGERQPGRALAKAHLLHDRDPASAWERWFAVHPVQGIDLRAGARFTSSDLVLGAAAKGLGVALARDRLAARDVSAGLLVRPFGAAKVSVSRAYWLVQPRDREPRPAAQALAQWIRLQATRTLGALPAANL